MNMSKPEVSPEDVIKILQAMINFMEITLLGESLSPNADMEREENITRLETLIEKLNQIKDIGFQKPAPTPAKKESVNKFWKSEKKEKPPRHESTSSSYIDMHQDSPKLATKNISVDAGKAIEQEQVTIEPVPIETEMEEEEYEVPGSEFSPDTMSTSSSQEDSYEELKKKVKSLEKYSPQELKENCTYSGFLLKHKKRMLTKWHKRYCILRDDFIFYFKSESDNKEQGVIILPGYTFAVPPKDKGFLFMLESVDKSRDSYTFQADHKEEFELWKKHICVITSKALSTVEMGIMNKVAKENFEVSYEEDRDVDNNTEEQQDLYNDVAEIQQFEDQGIYNDVADGATPVSVYPQPTILPNEEIEDTQGELYEPIAGEQQPTTTPLPPPPRQHEPLPHLPLNIPMRSPVHPPVVISPTIDAPLSPQFIPPRPSTKNLPIGPHIPPRGEPSPMPSPVLPSTGQEEFVIENIFMGLYDCQGEDKDDLSFNRGDILYKLDEIDMNWWLGYLNGKVGLVPSNFLVEAFE